MNQTCDNCEKNVVWELMSGHSKYCDDCVPRGCSCESYNLDEFPEEEEWFKDKHFDYKIEIIKDTKYLIPLDEKGREYPCCEFWDVREEIND